MPNTYKLTYFKTTGRAETTRLIFSAAGIPFEDIRVDFAEWAPLKPTTPFGQLPTLEVNGTVVLAQCMAIARFAAREAGLAGKTSLEQALVDMIVDMINELREKLFAAFFGVDDSKREAALTEFVTTSAPPLLEKINKFLAANDGGKGFLVGSALTWADLHLYSTIEDAATFAPKSPEAVDKFPLIRDLFLRVAALPKVAEYLKTRPPIAGFNLVKEYEERSKPKPE